MYLPGAKRSTTMTKNLVFRASASAILLTLFLLPGIAHAADVTVGCPGGGGGTYPSINAALIAIGQTGPSTITVTGTCNENVNLNNARSIRMVGGAGGAAIIGPQDFDTFDISLSQDITLKNLEIVGTPGSTVNTAGVGVVITHASDVHIIRCNIHDNQGGGVVADTASLLTLLGTTIQNNSPGDGLDVTNNSSVHVVGTTIQNNGGTGVLVLNRSSVIFSYQNLILNNTDVGIQAVDLSRVLFETADPSLFTTVQGHNADGIVAARQSVVVMGGGPHVIQNNGSVCPADPTCGGIFALRNSTVRLFAGNITGNHGSGVSVQQGVDLVLNDTTVSNNTGDGIHIQRISIGDFSTGNSITGNGGASLFCDERSLVIGDLSGLSKVRCDHDDPPDKSRRGDDDKGKEGKERNH
jgi:hypothetical protein